MSNQELAISRIKRTIKRWKNTYEMLSEYPNLKSDLKYIKKLMKKEEYKLAEKHMYYTLYSIGLGEEGPGVVADLADDLISIEQAILQNQ